MATVRKTVPKTFEECFAVDDTTKNLLDWSERLKTFGSRACIFLAIYGVISIINAVATISDISHQSTALLSLGYVNMGDLVIDLIFEWVIYCALEYFSFLAIALLLKSLASIVLHNRITANVTLYQAAIQNGYDFENADKNGIGWLTGNRANGSQNGTPNTQNSSNSNLESVPNMVWVCEKCGQKNAKQRTNCMLCNAPKP